MSRLLFWLWDEAWAAIEPHLPKNLPGARRVDHAVIKDGKAQTHETTSMTADKTGQLAKEQRIIDSGGSYVRARDTKQLVPVCGVSDVKRC
jgi:hypothetical protein